MDEKVGKIIHYYDKIGVAVVRLERGLKAGDAIHVKGKTADFEQAVESMQVDHKNVGSAKKGEEVAVKLAEKAREGDEVFRKS